jgi:hypothetical protein
LSCWSFHLLREEFLSAPIHSPLSSSPYRSFSDFLRGLLQFYGIELVHLALNSITIIATFIHLCEAYLDIAPHFHLWRHFF